MMTSNAPHPADHSFQRFATRYEPESRDACLTWWDSRLVVDADEPGPTDPEALRQFALLLDISHTGAAIALDRVPEAGEDVWLRLEGGSLTDWTEAEVVGVTTTTLGPHLVRLAFRDPCPFETLRAAICG